MTFKLAVTIQYCKDADSFGNSCWKYTLLSSCQCFKSSKNFLFVPLKVNKIYLLSPLPPSLLLPPPVSEYTNYCVSFFPKERPSQIDYFSHTIKSVVKKFDEDHICVFLENFQLLNHSL